ncbi:MAG: flagellar biosynthesis protein FlgL, partial [Firmicutes bacterium]|nr:flagellar biosynthesis protein FlgL [Bacillota bacterium]
NLTILQQDLSSISDAQSVIGGRLSRVKQESQYLTQLNQTLTATVSSIDGANMAEVASQLNLEEQAYQAALQTGAQVLSVSLLNYLHP